MSSRRGSREYMEVEQTGGQPGTFINPIERVGEDGQTSTAETTSEVLIFNKQLINGTEDESKGGFGIAYAVDVQVSGSDKKLPFVLKEPHGYMSDEWKERVVLNSVGNHRMAKRAGLKVWNTYRIAKDKKSVLMSTGHAEGWKLIGDYNKLDQKECSDFLPINDFESFLDSYYSEAEKAAKNQICIAGDVPFFRVRKDKLDFVLGDMDNLLPSKENEDLLMKSNFQNMHSRLTVFFENNFGDFDEDTEDVDAGDAELYVDQSRDYIKRKFGVEVTRYVE
jgi:hypothetical protein